jgi:hypothetical protein
VTGPDGRDLLRVRWSLQLGEVGALRGEELFYPAGHVHGDGANRAVGDVGVGVRDLPGQPGETARAQVVPLLAHLDQQVAVDHVKELVFLIVDVQRRALGPCRHHFLTEGEQAAGVGRSGLDHLGGARMAAGLAWRQHIRCCLLVHENLLDRCQPRA